MKKLIGFEYPQEKPEIVEVRNEVRICYMGAFLGKDEAEVYREEFFENFQADLDNGDIVVIQDDLVEINSHWVVRIMAQNAQMELDLE